MKTVLRLIWLFFAPTRLLCALSIAGLALTAAAVFELRVLPQSDFTLAPGALGIIGVFLGSSLMPVIFGRLARSPLITVLPYGRIRLLIAAFVVVAIVALPVPLVEAFGQIQPAQLGGPGHQAEAAFAARVHAANVWLFRVLYTSGFLALGWLYLAIWFVVSDRNRAGLARGLMVLILVVFAPTREIRTQDASWQWNVLVAAVLWSLFGCCFLLWPRWKILRERLPAAGLSWIPRGEVAGRELDLLLGTAHPWLLAAAMFLPVLLATRIGFYSAAVWVFLLTIFSAVAGAIAGQAAERSRSLWLRGPWSRAELFARVERAFWMHNAWVLGTLIVLMAAIGSYTGLPGSLLAVALPLLVLGTALSTYLGLMVTRGLHWIESLLSVAVMLALMAVAVMVAAPGHKDLVAILTLELLLACAAFGLRSLAKRRWGLIDWALCRPDRAALPLRGRTS